MTQLPPIKTHPITDIALIEIAAKTGHAMRASSVCEWLSSSQGCFVTLMMGLALGEREGETSERGR